MGDGQPKRSSRSVKGGSARAAGGGGKRKQTERHKSVMSKTPDDILGTGREYLDRIGDSRFFRANPGRALPEFERTELGFGKMLGSGAFCKVSEIIAMKLEPKDAATASSFATGHIRTSTIPEGEETEEGDDGGGGDNNKDPNENDDNGGDGNDPNDNDGEGQEEEEDDVEVGDDGNEHYDLVPAAARDYMSAQCLRDGDARYAVKRLRTDLSNMETAKGIVDLAVEARFLASVYHPNIIKMRGTTVVDPLGPDNFIVMDRLYDTLEGRIDQWAAAKKMAGGGCMGCIGGSNKEALNMIMVEQMTAAYDIASVFRYLHGHELVYRDIKPDNMGFDVRGDIKVFDFGLCKELTPKLKNKDGTYDLTGMTGSRRYMAPEVVMCKPYGPPADVFSFGILLWQILACDTPFEQFDPRDHTEQVVKGGYRPPVQGSWPVMTRGILKECWDAEPKERPEFARIASVLKGELTQIADEGEAGGRRGQMISRRSTHMMRKSQHSFRLHARGMNGSGRSSRL
mmetsp:Transcript_11789/g.34614  ORF Transcript_11789/g.34614 Transcript_11789/m.34614 type:complete len:513 (-) Transcript_11789:187-1725(-)